MGQIESVRSDQAVLLSRAVEVATKQKQDEVEEKAEEIGTNQLVGNFEHQVKVNFNPKKSMQRSNPMRSHSRQMI